MEQDKACRPGSPETFDGFTYQSNGHLLRFFFSNLTLCQVPHFADRR